MEQERRRLERDGSERGGPDAGPVRRLDDGRTVRTTRRDVDTKRPWEKREGK